jgi:uncharacterized membrane protein (Fun14 family)
MSIDGLGPIVATIGFGGIAGFFLGYFVKKLVKIIAFIVGGILTLLLYLQTQEIITINITKLQTYTDGIINWITSSGAQIPAMATMDHLSIPLSSSVTAGFVLGITRR